MKRRSSGSHAYAVAYQARHDLELERVVGSITARDLVNVRYELKLAVRQRDEAIAELKEIRDRLVVPEFCCTECGSTGPFTSITYPSTPNGPEEYDMQCDNCGSLHIDESILSALLTVINQRDELR